MTAGIKTFAARAALSRACPGDRIVFLVLQPRLRR